MSHSFRYQTLVGNNSTTSSAPPLAGLQLSVDPDSDPNALRMNDVAIGPDGCVYFCIEQRHSVVKCDPTTQIVSVYAGTWNSAGSTGDAGPADAARLNLPKSIAFDSAGNLYIADTGNHKIRKVDVGGNISTFMGTGSAGSSGDGGAPGSAQVDRPLVVRIFAGTTLYIAEDKSTNTGRIRKVTGLPAGSVVSTIVADLGFRATCLELDSLENIYIMRDGGVSILKCPAGGSSFSIFHQSSSEFAGEVMCGMGMSPSDDIYYFPKGSGGKTVLHRINTSGSPSPTFVAGYDGSNFLVGAGTPADGTDTAESHVTAGYRPHPSREANGRARIVVDQFGVIHMAWTAFYVKWIPASESLVGILTANPPTVVHRQGGGTGFNDGNTYTELFQGISSPVMDSESEAPVTTDLTALRNGIISNGNVVILGSSYSNQFGNAVEAVSKATRELRRCMVGVYKLDLLTLGGGNGALFGTDAPRIRLENRNGTFLIERRQGGGNVLDYAILAAVPIGSRILVYCAGIRDIATKAAAYALMNAGLFAAMAQDTCWIVKAVYPPSVTTPAQFTPSPSNVTVFRAVSVSTILL